MPDDPFEWDDSLLWPVDDIDLLKAVLNRRAPVGGFPVPPKDYKGGQFIPAEAWEREKALAKLQLPDTLRNFGNTMQIWRSLWEDVQANPGMKTTPGQIRWAMKAEIRRTYEDAFTLGKRAGGNLFAVTDSDKKAIKKTRYDEFTYLKRFMEDMRTGGGKMDYQTRMDYYVKAARELYWLGFARADMSPERKIWWTLGPTEHCDSCLAAYNGSPYTGQEFWDKLASKQILPQSGALDCLGFYCQCGLKDTTPETEALARGKRPKLVLLTTSKPQGILRQ